MDHLSSKKKNILYVFGGEKAQGAEIVIERLMHHNSNRYNTHLVLAPGDFAESLLTQNKPYIISTLNNLKKLNRASTVKFNYYRKALKNYFIISAYVYKYVKRHQINIVHGNTLAASAYLLPCIFYARITGLNVKWLWSDHDLQFFSRLEHSIAKQCYRFYDRTLIVSMALKKKYGKQNRKLVVLYNGLDPDTFKKNDRIRKAFREKWLIDYNELVICIAGSINPDKGQLLLIEMFNKIAPKYPQLKLILAGSYAQQFPDYAAEVKLAISKNEKIKFIGFVTDTAMLFNGCDIIVNNSNNFRSESLGTTIYEAMACEKIVVASNTGGTPEIINDKMNGFLFEPENGEQLEIALANVVENFLNLTQLQSAARQKVIKTFNISNMAKAYNEIVKSVSSGF